MKWKQSRAKRACSLLLVRFLKSIGKRDSLGVLEVLKKSQITWKESNMSPVQDTAQACRFCQFTHLKEPMDSLRIPPEFWRHYPDELPHRVILKDPSVDEWTTKLRNYDNGVYLQDGWKNFQRDNSLRNREFLLFWYDGRGTSKCRFSIL